MGSRFQKFSKRFETHFRRWTRSVAEQAQQYLQGLMQARRKNMERMEEVVPECDYQSLHHFVSESAWDAQAVSDQVAVEADRLLGGSVDSCLLLDESSFEKKGEKSVGVARQWRGWIAWHHHVALVIMAMLFMLEEKLSHQQSHPLLSCSDIEVLLAHFLPRRDVTVEEVVRQMEARHQARQRAIASAYRRQQLADSG